MAREEGVRTARNLGSTETLIQPESVSLSRYQILREITDLFAVGAILWEAPAGRPMRQHADLLAGRIESRPLARMPAPQSPAQACLADLVAWLTENEPVRRPSSAAQALHKLVDYSSSSSSGSDVSNA